MGQNPQQTMPKATPGTGPETTRASHDSFDAELLAKIDGTRLSVGYHNPFLIQEPDLIWLVLKGSLDIFAVPVVAGKIVGTGQHLLRVEAGELVFGMAPAPAQPAGPPSSADESAAQAGQTQIALRAVATMGTELYRARRRDIEDEDFDIIVVDWIDTWIGQLATVLMPVGGPRADGFLEAEPGLEYPAKRVLLPQARDTIWLQADQGEAKVAGNWPIPGAGEGRWFPLSGNLWLACENACTLSGIYTPTALFRGALWQSLDGFHRVFMGALAKRLAENQQRDAARLEQRAAGDRLTFGGALRRIAGILRPLGADRNLTEGLDATADPLHEAARLVAAASGISIAPPARAKNPLAHPLEEIARRSQVRTRRVLLRDQWHRQDNDPLLGYLGADQRPVALIPDGPRRYRLIDPSTNTEQPVTDQVAEQLAGEAQVLYRPFPAHALNVREVLRFGLAGLRLDPATVLAMGLLTGLLALATPIATSQILSDIIPRADVSMHLMLVAGLVLAALGAAAFAVARSFAMLRLQTRMDARIQTAVWDRLLSLPVSFFRDYTAGDLADRANGINAIREVLSSTVIQAALNLVFSVFSLVLLFWYSWKLALVALAVVLVILGLSFLVTLMQLPLQREMIGRGGKIEGLVFQLLVGLSKLRISAAEARAFARWAEQFSITKDLTYRARRLAALQQVLNALFPLIASIVFFAMISFALNKSANPGGAEFAMAQSGFGIKEFLGFLPAFGQFSGAMTALLGTLTTLITIVPLYERARPILEAIPERSELKADPGALDGHIEFSSVLFRYDPQVPPAVNQVSLRIPSGSYVAFVGASGSGKSTLVRLLLGFEQPESGGVYIDGRDISGLDMQAVRRQIGVVLQNGRIMSGSIFDNIVGSLPLTIDDAWQAAEMAGFSDDIKQMPMGMHTVLPDGAASLSGGQRQRLMIARALVHKPRILILDEATSALDNRTQDVVNKSLAKLNMTRIVVAHRLSTIERVDRIFVMRQGSIAESGGFRELMDLNGEFAELARRQMV
ncbi:NHLP bacteriocin export ABC transporter permease/ATPase subunit [Thiorhodovibrio frisius]|uniref:NHLM bacteriocin system ABC transporter, ATP-binding protein n=1 Tax=Thiorhodovibrio frisius TaxID=631362 RepID=H8Z1L5_9GAMM|nr:NHLP bacteriocin export ABC transporter permease/ATPase subunit [Thiorhodovibrio frisius]EIC21460.1 NHLM bacteriocin system ABC transporter, ATP-binding protein [Thiorhodovibrio frisius]WPL24046.1 RTX-I toxin determinant B [Thiorhodovibrio frisius]